MGYQAIPQRHPPLDLSSQVGLEKEKTMDNEERIEIEAIEDCKPIEKGWFILVSNIFSILVCLLVIGGLTWAFLRKEDLFVHSTHFWLFWLGSFVPAGMITFLVLSHWKHSFEGDFSEWIREYWDRNVKGWSYYAYMYDKQLCKHIARRNDRSMYEHSSEPLVEVALGGWFNRSEIRRGNGWRIRKDPFFNPEHQRVQLAPPKGPWMKKSCFDVDMLFHGYGFLYWHGECREAITHYRSYPDLTGTILYQKASVWKELVREKSERQESEGLVERLASLLDFTINTIDESRKSRKNPWAEELRKHLQSELPKLFPEGHWIRQKHQEKAA